LCHGWSDPVSLAPVKFVQTDAWTKKARKAMVGLCNNIDSVALICPDKINDSIDPAKASRGRGMAHAGKTEAT
jgi:hypothetical protein